MFDHVVNFKIKEETLGMDLEEFELEMIEFEVEEVFQDDEDNTVMLYAPFTQFGSIQKYLEDNNIEIVSSEFERIPTTTTALTDEQKEEVNKLLERLEEDDDVNNVYHSMEE